MSFHEGIGPGGHGDEATPEGNASYAPVGFVIGLLKLRILEGEKYKHQYLIGYEHVRGIVIRRNRLTHRHRILVMYGYGGQRKEAGFIVARDIIIAHNTIVSSPVGVEIDTNTVGVVIYRNDFKEVQMPILVHGKVEKRVIIVKRDCWLFYLW